MLTFLIAGGAAALGSLVITPAVIRAAVLRSLFDVPADERRVHTHPIPRLGGVAVFTSMVFGLGVATLVRIGSGAHLSASQSEFSLAVLLGGGVLFAAGLADDLWGLRPLLKVLAQVVAAVVIYALGFQVEVLSLGSVAGFSLGWLSLPLTIFWIVGVTNAFNLIDGLDGLATGVALVALTSTLAAALVLGNLEVVIVCVALIGALFGFLRYNFSPARIFLGDSGSLFIGFMLAVLSVHGSLKSATAVLVVVPLFALAVPLLDTLVAIGRRWLRGMPLSNGDARHIHHRLLALGLSHRRAAIVIYVVASVLAMLGLSLAFAPPTLLTGATVAGGLLSLCLLAYGMYHLEYHEFAEAGAVLASGVLRIRRVIRDQIHARDVAQVIARAETLAELDAILDDNASNFGFLGMEICREASGGRFRGPSSRGYGRRSWKLDYPVASFEADDDDPFVLRIWSDPERGSRPFGAERVAGILAPVIEKWIARVDQPRSSQVDGSAESDESEVEAFLAEAAAVRHSAPVPRRESGTRSPLAIARRLLSV